MIADSLPKPYPLVREVLGDTYDEVEEVQLTPSLQALVVAAPGTALSPAAQQEIYRALVPVSSASFGADMTEYWRDRAAHDYFGRLAEFVLIADGDGAMVGWTGYSVLETGSAANVYIDSSGLVPSGQSRGVMRGLMRRRLTEGILPHFPPGKFVYISARSESPIFYRLMQGIVGARNLFPNPGYRTPPDVLQCGCELAKWLGQGALMEAGSLIVRNAYAVLDELYGELPSSGDPALDAMFRNSLGPLDAYLLVGAVACPRADVATEYRR